jgi:WD40 repeat protein
MSVTLRCPHPACGKPSNVPGEHLGRTVRCPHCRQPFTATAPAPDPAPTPSIDIDAVRATLKGPPPLAPSADLPSAVGRFQVRSRLGQGAFGAVYRAYDPQLDREVALKVPLPGALDTPQRVKRFLREARAAAGLRHPHIVPVFDAGGEPPHCYIAAAFIDGRTLARALRDGPMDFRRAARLARELAGALAYAHRQGILHRDVKPANVMLDAADEAHLTDFGLAHRLEGAEKLTQDGALLGTPAYMAPEHVAEPGREPQPAGDQYSLGVVLYELLCGRMPFEGTPEVVLFNALHTEPVPPRSLRPGVPRDLETVCLKAMAKRPQDRYATCEALADDLRRWLEGEPIRARRTSLVARTVKWARRRPAQALAIVFLAACLVLGVGYLVTAANLREAEALKALADGRAAGEQSQREAAEAAANTEQQLRKEADAARDLARTNEHLAKTEHARAEALLNLNRVTNAYSAWRENRVPRAEQLLDACPVALRNWEWGYVKRLCQRGVLVLRDHTANVSSLCFSPDGRRVAGADADKAVTIWDATAGTVQRMFNGHSKDVIDVRFSPDGRLLATAGADKAVKLWDVASGKEERTMEAHPGDPHSLCFTPDGRHLLGVYKDNTIVQWVVATGNKESAFRGPADPRVVVKCLSPDTSCVAGADPECTIKIWDRATGQVSQSLKGHTVGVEGVCFSPDGKRLASAGRDWTVRVWDAVTGKALHTLEGHADTVEQVCFSPDGKHLASASDDHTIRLWDAATGKEERTISGHEEDVNVICFSPDGKRLASASDDDTVRVWDLQSEPEARSLVGHTDEVSRVCFSPDGKLLASAGDDPVVRLWNLATGKEEHTLNGHTDIVRGLCFSPDGKRLASASRDKSVKLWDVLMGKEERTFAGSPSGVGPVCFSPDGKLLAYGGGDLRILDVMTGEVTRTFLQGGVNSGACFSPDGQRLASCHGDGTVIIWNVTMGQEERRFRGIHGFAECVRFSPDGKRVAAAGYHGRVMICDAETGKDVFPLEGHVADVHSVCFNPDGTRLASASDDGTIKIWDMATGLEALSLKGQGGGFNAVCFSPDGRFLASGGDDKTVKLWDSGPR